MKEVIALKLDGDAQRLVSFDPESHEVRDVLSGSPEGLLVPGFVDIHIHGAFGLDTMSASSAEMVTLCEKLATEGYEAFLPTTITAPFEDVLDAVNRLPDHPMIAGFHLEGPFISSTYPGAQPLEHIAALGDGKWNAIWDHPKLKLITIAPEIPGALELIARLTQRGVICSMGHTDAKFDDVVAAVDKGLKHATHTFNAMRPLHHREAGAVGAALTLEGITCELIYDRIHVSKPVASLLVDQKSPHGKLIGVSDSSAATGLAAGTELTMWGHECIVGAGQVNLKSNGSLAGSAVSLRQVFQNLVQDFGIWVAQEACCLAPRRTLGIESVNTWNLVNAETGELLATYSKG